MLVFIRVEVWWFLTFRAGCWVSLFSVADSAAASPLAGWSSLQTPRALLWSLGGVGKVRGCRRALACDVL